MTLRTLLLVLVLAAVGAFAALNWSTFTSPTSLSLGVASVDAPIGLIMLGALVVVSLTFLAYIFYLQTSVLLETRRHARELQANRTLADQAEASRFTELHKFIESELQLRSANDAERHSVLMTRIERLEDKVHASLEDANNTVAAYLGQLEDRLERNNGHDTRSDLPLRRDHH